MSQDSDQLTEAAKATREVAKTAGKAIDSANNFGEFISKYIDGVLEQGIGIFEDKLKYMRWERQVRLMKRADETMKAMGREGPSRAIPMKLAIPLFSAASLEDDNYLQDLWVNLLVNSTVPNTEIELRRVYIDILERITPIEAKILKAIYAHQPEELQNKAILTFDLPNSAPFEKEREGDEQDPPPYEVIMALANLARLGCVSLPTTWGGGEIFTSVYPTILGWSLVNACTIDEAAI